MWEGLRGERCNYILISKNSKKLIKKNLKTTVAMGSHIVQSIR